MLRLFPGRSRRSGSLGRLCQLGPSTAGGPQVTALFLRPFSTDRGIAVALGHCGLGPLVRQSLGTRRTALLSRPLEAVREALLSRPLEAVREALLLVVRRLGLHRLALPHSRPQSLVLGPLGARKSSLRHGVKGQTMGQKGLTRRLSCRFRPVCCCLHHRAELGGGRLKSAGDRLRCCAKFLAPSRSRRLDIIALPRSIFRAPRRAGLRRLRVAFALVRIEFGHIEIFGAVLMRRARHLF